MSTQSVTGNGLVYFSTPRIKLEVALHRRGNEWFVVYPRAYGMAEGNRLFGQISSPHEPSSSIRNHNATHEPPPSNPNLNPRFWLRNGKDFGNGYANEMLEMEDLLRAEPPVLKDSGLKRTRKVIETTEWSGGNSDGTECIEILVEVLVKEEGLCHRCAICGQWEDCYMQSPRHKEIGGDKNSRPIYWCGTCSKTPRWWDRYWWYELQNIPLDVYFK